MNTVVFDIDGTLADIEHRRVHLMQDEPDWKTFNSLMHLDVIHEDIRRLLFQLEKHNYIVLCSGREDCFRQVTEEFLDKNNVVYEALYMRAEGDFRSDDIIKLEMLEKVTSNFERPWLWIDDRDKVVQALRGAGIRVLQVCNGDY